MAVSYLENLKKQALKPFSSYGAGSWTVGGVNLPEFGKSEMLGGNKTSINNATQRVLGNTAPTSTYTAPIGLMSPTGWTKPGSGDGGGGTPNYIPSNDTTDLRDNANEGKNSAIDAIKSRLGMIRDIANRQIGVAGGVRDELKSNIASTYGGLKTSAEQKVGTMLENLGQARTGIYDTYGTAKGESRRALESAMLKNRVLARAMGRVDSSFYDDRQAEATETGARNIGGLAREEAGKVAGIGTQETETKNWGEQTALQIEQEQAQLTSQADQEYQQKVNEAMDMERAFGIDSEEQLRNAETEYQSKLGAITQYIENKGMRVAEIMAQAGIIGSSINDFTAFTPSLNSVLDNKTAYNRARTTEIPTMNTVTESDPNALLSFNQRTDTSALDDLRRRLGLDLTGNLALG